MVARPPAEPGQPVSAIDTPALVVELERLERNIETMAERARAAGVRLRPHAKTHKCGAIARRQLEAGAVGVCCQKVSEAQAMVEAGVPDVLVSNEVVGERKLARLAALAAEARVGVCVDDAGALASLARAVGEVPGAEITVLVEVDVGAGRCGVAPGPAALELARAVACAPGLRFGGIQAYHGSAQHLRSFAERRAAIDAALARVGLTLAALAEGGLACETVAGAGTGTFPLEAASGVWNELQPGSYVFMDADYARIEGPQGAPFRDFGQSLFVLATVMSTPVPERAIVDAGLKALSVDSGLPLVEGHPDIRYVSASDEHGKLDCSQAPGALRLGERVRLVPGHCDPTVNLHDHLVAVRGERVAHVWPIDARGALW